MNIDLRCTARLRALLCTACCAVCVIFALAAGGVARAAESRSYTSDLATMFNEYQRVLALRDACLMVQPALGEEVTAAYQEWQARHARIIDDLDNRFAAIVKRASKDQADYTKNYGKYQAEVYQMREENKKTMLANREKLAQQCREFPGYLRHPKSDIPTMFPAEFKGVYRVR
jgi:hypothetical protein